MSLIAPFASLLESQGSDVLFVRVDSTIPCPCLTPEGFRDPEWHIANSGAEVCNEEGKLADPAHTVNMTVKAFVQPAQSTRATRLTTEIVQQMFGQVQADDHLGIFPASWSDVELDFYDWSASGEDYVEYNSRRYIVVAAHLIPDPSDGNPRHHWEVGLRLINSG